MSNPYRWGDVAPPAVQKIKERRAKREENAALDAAMARFKDARCSHPLLPAEPPSVSRDTPDGSSVEGSLSFPSLGLAESEQQRSAPLQPSTHL